MIRTMWHKPMPACLVLLLLAVTSCGSEDIISGKKLADQLKQLGEKGLGVAEMQRLVDQSVFTATPVEGKSALQELALTMEHKLGQIALAVGELKTAIEEEYQRFDTNAEGMQQCCEFNDEDAETADKFQAEVDPSKACYIKSPDTISSPILPLSNNVLEVLKHNNKVASGTWQHIGTEQGILVTYPAHLQEDCTDYDPRYRPWYVETAVPVAIDLAICLDRSQSMKGDKLLYAKEAIETVLSTLNPNDRVGLVSFSNDALTPPGPIDESCYDDELAYAIPANVRYLKYFLSKVSAGGSTSYIAALERAFQLLKANEQTGRLSRGKPRSMVLLFFTDGKPITETSKEILNKTRTLNAKMNNKVTILTYLVGETLDDESKSLLENMAQLNETSEVYRGQFRHVKNLDDLRLALGTFYNVFNYIDEAVVPKATAPYIDFNTKRLTVSMCLPIYSYDQTASLKTFRGVTCMDFRPQEITSDIKYSGGGEMSYGFIIDGDGRVVLHPLVPTPHGDHTVDPFTIDIEDVETDALVKDVIQKMKKGESGELLNINRNILIPTGKSVKEGVDTVKVLTSYFWQPVPMTNFSICLVITERDKKVTIDTRATVRNFVYHRLDLLSDGLEVNTCNNYNKLSTKDHSVCKLTPEAFSDPYHYLNMIETNEDVKRYRKEIIGDIPRDKFKDGVAQTVAITEQIEDTWTQGQNYYHGNTVWRYFCTFTGVCRIYPGVAINQQYDHTIRAWYTRTAAHRNKYVLSTPYIDGWGSGEVLTLSHTIFIGKQLGHSINDMLYGVIAMDFKLHFVRGLIQDLFPICGQHNNSCFLLETSGYLVYHDDFLKEPEAQLEYVHVTVKEPDVAHDLINRGYLKRRQCRNLDDKHEYHTWQLQIQTGYLDSWDNDVKYKLQEVPGTNVFIVIKAAFASVVTCDCRETGDCIFIDDDKCECPCYTMTRYAACQNKYTVSDDDVELCFPDSPEAASDSPVEDEQGRVANLERCFAQSCEGKGTDWECKQVGECSWCLINSTETRERCRDSTQCGKKGPDDTKDGRDDNDILFACIGVIVFIALIVVLILVLKKRGVILKRKRKKSGSTKSITSRSLSDSFRSMGHSSVDSQQILYNPPISSYMGANSGPRGSSSDPSRSPPRHTSYGSQLAGTGENDVFHSSNRNQTRRTSNEQPTWKPPTTHNGVMIYEPGWRSPMSPRFDQPGVRVNDWINTQNVHVNPAFDRDTTDTSTSTSQPAHYERPGPVPPRVPNSYQPLESRGAYPAAISTAI